MRAARHGSAVSRRSGREGSARTRFACIVVCVATAFAAGASTPARADETTGLALYDEGVRLDAKKEFEQACSKFADSQKQYPRPVTLLRLADCYEKIGKTASAWSTFRDAKLASESVVNGGKGDVKKEKMRIDEATRRIDALEPKLTRLKLVVEEQPKGLEVKRDGESVPDSTFGVGIPLDPGKHVFEATATGAKPWRAEVDVSGAGKTVEVRVPRLAATTPVKPDANPDPKPTPTPDPKPTPVKLVDPVPTPVNPDKGSSGSGQRTAGLVVAGVGLVATGVGTFLGLMPGVNYISPSTTTTLPHRVGPRVDSSRRGSSLLCVKGQRQR